MSTRNGVLFSDTFQLSPKWILKGFSILWLVLSLSIILVRKIYFDGKKRESVCGGGERERDCTMYFEFSFVKQRNNRKDSRAYVIRSYIIQ